MFVISPVESNYVAVSDFCDLHAEFQCMPYYAFRVVYYHCAQARVIKAKDVLFRIVSFLY